MMRWLDSITNSMDMTLSELQQTVKDREAQRAAVHGITVRHDLVTEQQKYIFLDTMLSLTQWITVQFKHNFD